MGAMKGYKPSDMGLIPDGWEVRPVGKMGAVRAGKALAANAPGKQRPYLRTKNVFDGRIDLNDVLSMPMSDVEFSRYRLRYGDVLLNEGQSIDLVGRCAMYKDEYPEPCAIQNQLLRFRAVEGTSPEFAMQLFRRCQQTGVFSKIALQTTSVAHLGVNRFESLQLAWPQEEAEQEAIATVLSETDSLIESLEQLIAKKRQIKKGAMQELLTGGRRLPGFSGSWSEVKFGDVATRRTERVDPRKGSLNDFCVELEHIDSGSGTLSGWTIASAQSSLKSVFHEGDVLFGKLRAYLRKYWLADRSGVCSTEVWCLMPKGLLQSSELLFQIVQADSFIEAASVSYGTHMPRSDWGAVKEYVTCLPNDRVEQIAIASVLADIGAEIAGLEIELAKARQIKQGMMQELLAGRIRLV